MKRIAAIFILSFLILGTATLLSYYFTKEHSNHYKLGWPFVFYYQFSLGAKDNYFIQHGTNGINMIYNYALSLLVSVLIFYGFNFKFEKDNPGLS